MSVRSCICDRLRTRHGSVVPASLERIQVDSEHTYWTFMILSQCTQTNTHAQIYIQLPWEICPLPSDIERERYKKTILFVNSFFYINKKNRVFQLHSVTWYSNGLGKIYTHAWNFGSKLPANGFLIIYGLFIFWT